VLFSTNGTPTNTAIHKYVTAKKVPHLFIAAGASKWGDPKNYSWSTAFDLPGCIKREYSQSICSKSIPVPRSEFFIRTMTPAGTI
jgi:hypothetical protein